MSLTCPACYFPKSEVTDSRAVMEPMLTVRRRRTCAKCDYRWTTYEVSEDVIRRVRAAIKAVAAIRRMDIEEIDFVGGGLDSEGDADSPEPLEGAGTQPVRSDLEDGSGSPGGGVHPVGPETGGDGAGSPFQGDAA